MLFLALLVSFAAAEPSAVEHLRRQVEEEGMDLVRLQVQAVGPLEAGDLGTLTFPAGAPAAEATVLDYLPVMELESLDGGHEALLVVPLEVTGLIREARRDGVAFRLAPRLEPGEMFRRLFEYEGIHDRLLLPEGPEMPANRAWELPRSGLRGRVAEWSGEE